MTFISFNIKRLHTTRRCILATRSRTFVFLSACLTAFYVMSSIFIPVMAVSGDLTFTVDIAGVENLRPGSYVEIPIKVSNNPGMAAITGLRISWNSDQLMYDDRLETYDPGITSAARKTWPFTVPAVHSDGGIFERAVFMPPAEGTLKLDDSITFGFAAMENSNINGTLITLKFKVKDDAAGTIDFALSLVSVKNQEGTELNFNLVDGNSNENAVTATNNSGSEENKDRSVTNSELEEVTESDDADIALTLAKGQGESELGFNLDDDNMNVGAVTTPNNNGSDANHDIPFTDSALGVVSESDAAGMTTATVIMIVFLILLVGSLAYIIRRRLTKNSDN